MSNTEVGTLRAPSRVLDLEPTCSRLLQAGYLRVDESNQVENRPNSRWLGRSHKVRGMDRRQPVAS